MVDALEVVSVDSRPGIGQEGMLPGFSFGNGVPPILVVVAQNPSKKSLPIPSPQPSLLRVLVPNPFESYIQS